MQGREQRIEAYVQMHRKSPLAAFLLALAFGPLGFAYASLSGTLTCLIIAALAWLVVPWSIVMLLLLLLWVICVLLAPFAALEANRKLATSAELLAAPDPRGLHSSSGM